MRKVSRLGGEGNLTNLHNSVLLILPHSFDMLSKRIQKGQNFLLISKTRLDNLWFKNETEDKVHFEASITDHDKNVFGRT